MDINCTKLSLPPPPRFLGMAGRLVVGGGSTSSMTFEFCWGVIIMMIGLVGWSPSICMSITFTTQFYNQKAAAFYCRSIMTNNMD